MHKRAQSANNGGAKRSTRRKYTKSVDINVGEMISRAGKATTHFYLPIAQAKRAQERKALGIDANSLHDERLKEVVPGIRELRQKRAIMMN